jgi:hypothetical protein
MANKLVETPTQRKITNLVEDYIEMFPQEYQNFRDGMKQKVELQQGDFSEMEGSDVIDRALFEIPETLYSIFQTKLTDEEYHYLFPKPDKNFKETNKEGPRWFARKFKAFRLTKKV